MGRLLIFDRDQYKDIINYEDEFLLKIAVRHDAGTLAQRRNAPGKPANVIISSV
jgi:hypothetical protein